MLSLLVVAARPARAATTRAPPAQVKAATEQWGVLELSFKGPTTGNPFDEVQFSCQFFQERGSTEVRGFYDGGGVYRVRFMPPKPGKWYFTTVSSAVDLEGISGEVTVAKARPGNHGPVGVANEFHFAHADGTAFNPIGVTWLAWGQLGPAQAAKSLRTLAASPFNKLRLAVLPVDRAGPRAGPESLPFEGTAGHLDTQRMNPGFFQRLEQRIAELEKLGVEADLVLLHPHGRRDWGFDQLPTADEERYLHYVVARLSAFRNVWWSLADDIDSMTDKTDADFDRLAKIVSTDDCAHHLLSVQAGQRVFNQTRPWISHADLRGDVSVDDTGGRAVLYRGALRKPIVFDEVSTKGASPERWGTPVADEIVARFWQGIIAGAYVGLGEAAGSGGGDTPWWSRPSAASTRGPGSGAVGSTGRGQTPIAFLRRVVDDSPPEGIDPIDDGPDSLIGGRVGSTYLVYFGTEAPTSWAFRLPGAPASASSPAVGEGMRFGVEVLDTVAATITPAEGTFTLARSDAHSFTDRDRRSIPLPGRPYIAIRIKRLP